MYSTLHRFTVTGSSWLISLFLFCPQITLTACIALYLPFKKVYIIFTWIYFYLVYLFVQISITCLVTQLVLYNSITQRSLKLCSFRMGQRMSEFSWISCEASPRKRLWNTCLPSLMKCLQVCQPFFLSDETIHFHH